MRVSLPGKRRWRVLFCLAAGVALVAPTGCVRRRLTIRSNPSGALVYVDKQEVGVTPVSTPFTYYGTREVEIFAEGFEPLRVKQPVPAPWYQIPPLDFFAENLWPGEIRDERQLQFELQPQQVHPPEKLMERAENLRGSHRGGYVTPLPATTAPALPGGASSIPGT